MSIGNTILRVRPTGRLSCCRFRIDSVLQRVLVTGGAGYIGTGATPSNPPESLTLASGSHVIYALQKTRRYKVISIDNYHNSHPAALSRVAQLAKDNLPANPTEFEKESAVIDEHKCDLTKSDEVRAVFEKYGKGGIWGVIHIAVRARPRVDAQHPTKYTSA